MKVISDFKGFLILEAKPYTAENFRLFTQIVGTWLKQEFINTVSDSESFIPNLPFYDANYDVKKDFKTSNRPVSLADVEEQEKDNFLSYLRRIGKSTLIGTNFAEALFYYGNFIWQLPKTTRNIAVSKLKKNFTGLESTMQVLIKRNTKPLDKFDREAIESLIKSTEMPREYKKRGRKPGSKNKPKFVVDTPGLKLPLDIIQQFRREGKRKIDQLESEVEDLYNKIQTMTASLNQEIRSKLKEIDLRKQALGIND